jgi:hypothetical protein
LIRLRERLNRNWKLKVAREKQEASDDRWAQRAAVGLEGSDLESSSEEEEEDVDVQSVKVVYVDNCCSVHRILERCFPGAMLKLDAFHWLKRWNDLLANPTTHHGGIFRGLMSRALFNVEPAEYDRAKHYLFRKKRREPTVKEILREAKSAIPSPELLRQNVQATLAYFQARDAETERRLWQRRDTDTSPKPIRFLKPDCSMVRNTVRDQFSHIDKGCLSDPPSDVVNIFRSSPRGTVFVARGTNTNERDNLDLGQKVLSATHIGIHRADRLICGFFEERNHNKSCTRLGAEDHGTYETEKLILLNSYAELVGYRKHQLPYKDVPVPTVSADVPQEFIGFEYCMPCMDDVSNPTDDNATFDNATARLDDEGVIGGAEHEEQLHDNDFESFLNDLFGEELDVPVPFPEDVFEEPTTASIREVTQQMDTLELTERVNQRDSANQALIQSELAKLLPNNSGRESTLDSFRRLCNEQPWLPFRFPDSDAPETDVDKSEAALFHEWSVNYDRNDNGHGIRTYRAFNRAWNNEVTRRFTLWSNGADIEQIRFKSRLQLQQYYDKIQEWRSLQATMPSRQDDTDRQTLQDTIHRSRQALPPTQPAHQCTPPFYERQPHGTTPFGNPTTLNADITLGAVAAFGNNNDAPPFELVRPQLPLQPATRSIRKVFRSRKYCFKCGCRRNEHDIATEGVAESCVRQYCGKCYKLKQFHKDDNGNDLPFGIHCTLPTDRYFVGNVNDWYDYKVRFK